MPILVVLLRGVNVGGKNKIKMDTLRDICLTAGLRDPQTYIQSGNVVCRASRLTASLHTKIEDAIEAACSFRPAVILRTAEELDAIVAANPFAAQPGIEPNKLHVHFLYNHPAPQAAILLEKLPRQDEQIHLTGREVFVYYPHGAGQTKLTAASFDKALQTSNTARNWNTVLKLRDIARSIP
ncbi:MAG: DUF1697 domain-containing protein [Bryobacterales bacterium]|nr:DUF1697 domain-containing protein [Bryobacterales bacterium]